MPALFARLSRIVPLLAVLAFFGLLVQAFGIGTDGYLDAVGY